MANFKTFTRIATVTDGSRRREVQLPVLVNLDNVFAIKKMGQGHLEVIDVSGNAIVVHDAFEQVELRVGAVK